MKTAADHIRAAIAEMEAERRSIASQIEVLRSTLASLEGGGGGKDDRPKPNVGRSIAKIAEDVAQSGEVFTLNEVLDAAKAEGNSSQYASVSSILSRMVRDGVLERGPRRGTYVQSGSEQENDAPLLKAVAGRKDGSQQELESSDRVHTDRSTWAR